MEGARRATGISPGVTPPPADTVSASFILDRIKDTSGGDVSQIQMEVRC